MSTVFNADHYLKDQCLGGSFVMDGLSVYSAFNADVYDIKYAGGDITSSYEKMVGKSSFEAYYFDFSPQEFEVSFYVGGMDKNDVLMNINNLIAKAKHCVCRYEDEDTFEFDCVLTNFEIEFTGIEWYYSVVLTFEAIRRRQIATKSSDGAVTKFEVDNFGTVVSGARVTITSALARSSINVTYYDRFGQQQIVTIQDVKADVPIVIDGIEGSVTEREANIYDRTDLMLFPMVQTGKNTFSCNYDVEWTVEYYPTYEI